MIRKVLMIAVAAGVFAAAASTAVFALAFALYAYLLAYMTPPASAAAVGLVIALCLALVGVVTLVRSRMHHKKEEPSASEKAMTFARQRPLITAAALLGAGFFAFRNPALAATVAASFLAPRPKAKH